MYKLCNTHCGHCEVIYCEIWKFSMNLKKLPLYLKELFVVYFPEIMLSLCNVYCPAYNDVC